MIDCGQAYEEKEGVGEGKARRGRKVGGKQKSRGKAIR